LKGLKKIVDTEGQARRDDLNRLDQGLEQTRRAVAELSESNRAGIQIATREIKKVSLESAKSTANTHATLFHTTVQDLETKITQCLTAVLARHN